MTYYYYLEKSNALRGIPLLLRKSDSRITDIDAEFGTGVAVEYIGEKLPFSVVYDEQSNTVREATDLERKARSTKRLYVGLGLLGKVWTDEDFSPDDFVHVKGDDIAGTINFLANIPFTIPYNKGFRIYASNGQGISCMKTTTSGIEVIPSGINSVFGGNINCSGALTAGGDVIAFSDKRVKKNIKKINNALNLCRNIEGVYFDRIEDDSKHIGFVADEVEKFIPEAVAKDSISGLKGLAYGNMTAISFNAITELHDIVLNLKKEVKTLKEEIKERDKMINKLLLIRGDKNE